jgi:sugar lactone lactonase YvrE
MHSVDGHHTSTWTLPDRLGCLAICESGRLVLGLAKGLFYGDFATATDKVMQVERIVAVDPHLNRHRINDGRTDRSGNFVFGTMNEAQDAATGSFYQFSAAHGLRRLDLGGVTIPNSICFSLDGLTMYFCDSKGPQIRQCDYDAASARVANVRDFVRFAEADGLPDGSVIDSEGCLWNAGWGAAVVRRFAPDGGLLATVRVPAKNATCAVFGGHNLTDLYVTSARQEMSADELEAMPDAGGVYRAEVGTTGVGDAQFRD